MVEGKLITTKRLYDCLEQKLKPIDSFKIRFRFDGDEISAKEEADRMIFGHLTLAKANMAVKEHEYIITAERVYAVGGPSEIYIPKNTPAYYQAEVKMYNLEKKR